MYGGKSTRLIPFWKGGLGNRELVNIESGVWDLSTASNGLAAVGAMCTVQLEPGGGSRVQDGEQTRPELQCRTFAHVLRFSHWARAGGKSWWSERMPNGNIAASGVGVSFASGL